MTTENISHYTKECCHTMTEAIDRVVIFHNDKKAHWLSEDILTGDQKLPNIKFCPFCGTQLLILK